MRLFSPKELLRRISSFTKEDWTSRSDQMTKETNVSSNNERRLLQAAHFSPGSLDSLTARRLLRGRGNILSVVLHSQVEDSLAATAKDCIAKVA